MEDDNEDPTQKLINRKHGMLSINAGRQLTKENIKEIKQLMVGYGEGQLEQMEDFFDIYSALERMNKVGIGEYGYLRDILESIDCLKLRDEILKVENEIRALQGLQPNTGERLSEAVQAEPMQVEQPFPRQDITTDATPILPTHVFHESCQPEMKYPAEFKTDGSNGHLLIIDEFTEHRKGSEADVRDLAKLFNTKFGFRIEYHENKTKAEIMNIYMDKADEFRRNGEVQRFFSVVLSHGDEKGIQTCSPPGSVHNQEREVRLNMEKDILPIFKSCDLPAMAGRPKVFFVQACRGVCFQEGKEVADDASATEQEEEIVTDAVLDKPAQFVPNDADVLVSYAQTHGYRAFRDKKVGSWYIQAICDILDNYHERYDLLTMLTMVGDRVSQMEKHEAGKICQQIPCLHSTLRKRVYMTP